MSSGRFREAPPCAAPRTPGRRPSAAAGPGAPAAPAAAWPRAPARGWTSLPGGFPPARPRGPPGRSDPPAAPGSSPKRPAGAGRPGAGAGSLWGGADAARPFSPSEPGVRGGNWGFDDRDSMIQKLKILHDFSLKDGLPSPSVSP